MGNVMAADPVVSRELKSLQEELSISRRERVAPPASPTPSAVGGGVAATFPGAPKEAAEEYELRQQLREFVNEITKFFDAAEKNIAAHPTESVVGAMLVGILIGRLLGRR